MSSLIAGLSRLLILVAMVLGSGACSTGANGRPFLASSDFDPERLIPAEHYALADVRCESRLGDVTIDGVVVQGTQWLVRGTLTNLLDTPSPHYELDVQAVLDDGRTLEREGRSFHSIGARASADFSIVVGSEHRLGAGLTTCEVVVKDSVLNYAR